MTVVWANTAGPLAGHVRNQTEQCLAAYRAKPNLIEQDAGIEISNVEGGYGRKQINELVQNSADALSSQPGRIALILASNVLYCANEGLPLSQSGVETLMASHISRKRDEEIGRFGLGFKSVLGISDRPEIISRDVSIRFDRAYSEQLARDVWPSAPRTPVLRIGVPFDPLELADGDSVLTSLMEWASTIVRLPLKEDVEWVGPTLLQFPPEFLLFSEHVTSIDLRSDVVGAATTWRAEREGSRVSLVSDDIRSDWNVFRTQFSPSDAAKRDAGVISGRSSVDVAWAVPVKNRTRTGAFWSYFPTSSQTTLSGIVNAPFKTNEDRHDILDGLYNAEILETVIPELVTRNLPELVDPGDPASVLEILPSRGRESRSWADEVINEPIMSGVSSVPCLPDMDGVLQRPTKVKLQPAFLSEFNSWKPRWGAVEGRPSDWVHGSVDRTAERRAKAERLVSLAKVKIRGVGEWLHDLAAAGGIVGSQEAIKLAAHVDAEASEHMVEMRKSAFVLSAAGTLKAPLSGRIFLPESDDERGTEFVSPAVAADGETIRALAQLGIGRLDQLGRLRAHIARMGAGKFSGEQVGQMWNLTRGLAVKDVATVLGSAFGTGNVPVRSLARRPAKISDVLLPGVIVPADGSRDAQFTIDTVFHASDLALLRMLGAVSEPQLDRPGSEETWFQEWEVAAKSAYAEWSSARGTKVQQGKIRIVAGRTLCGLDVGTRLSAEGRRALTQVILRGGTTSWSVDATSSTDLAMPFANPALWWVSRHGVVETGFGPQPIANALARVPGIPDELLPVAKVSAEHASVLGLKQTLDVDDWTRILLRPWDFLPQDALEVLYGYAAKAGAPCPDEMGLVVKSAKTLVSPGDVFVTDVPSDFDVLKDGGYPVLYVSERDQLRALLVRWRLQDAQGLVNRTILAAASGESTLIGDRFPGLRAFVNPVPELDLIPCSDLSVEISAGDAAGAVQTEHAVLRDGERTVYFLDSMNEVQMLAELSSTLRLGLSDSDQRKIIDIGARGEVNKLRKSVSKEANQDRKLVMLAGVEALRKELPAGADKLAEARRGRKLTDEEIAGMARASKGAGLLTKLAPAIEEKGLVLPKLSGGSLARAAVKELGLAPEFAGSRTPTPAARFEVLGPVTLPPLHGYQEKVVENLLDVLTPGGKNRGLVALPTGSGKTRVAVEALIRYAKNSETEPLILWIAQSDELCEQAVETWSYTWTAMGEPGGKLTISRLWGANDATPAEEGAHLVVATDAKLLSLSRKAQHEWLTGADVVLVDEAHTSISKTYTELFRWLNRGVRERDRPLIGLSASPYRGNNELQTQGLVNRYDSNLLTGEVFGDDPHRELQDMGILAKVRHLELEGMTLTPGKHRADTESEEAMHLNDYRIDLAEVAADNRRNQGILDSLESLPLDMTALVFAASVQHAEVLAAVLCNTGVPAAAIAGYTPASERRRLIERFKTGEIRVLTNYNVLSQGFDAPKVGAVYVARPTFSPNRYQQMIGRGLRGPLNGGSEEVLIVNVKDNIEAFGTQLAFHHFDELWKKA